MIRIAILVAVGLLALLIGYAVVATWILNPRVVREVEASPNGERAQRVMLLTLPSGKRIPVNYLLEEREAGVPQDGDQVYAGADFPWWKELRDEGGRVEVLIRGQKRSGQGRAIEDDPERRASVFARLRPNAISWAGTLVAIRLDAPG